MNTKKISHFGILVRDADAAATLWTESFGLQKFDEARIDVEGIRSVFLSVNGTWDDMVIEIMEPLEPENMENALSRRLAKSGEGFYHMCLVVDDVESSGKELEPRGMQVMIRPPVNEGDSARWLVHPKDANGVMVEAIERQPDGKA